MISIKIPILYKIVKFIFGPIFRFYYNPKIIGKENIPSRGRVIIASCHLHIFDQCSVIISTNRFIHYMAKKEYFDNKLTRWFFIRCGCIRVDRNGDTSDAKEKAIKVLNNDEALGIFPEGTRNKTKERLLPFKYGTVSLANKTNSVIVPVGISGSYKFRSKNLVIRIGKPFKVSGDLDQDNKRLYNEIDKLIK